MVLVAGLCFFLYVLELSLDNTGDSDFRADPDLAGCNLRIFAMSANLAGLFYFAVSALLAGFIVFQNFNGYLAGMEAALASLCRGFLEFFSDFELESTAFQIFVKALVGLDHFAHILILLIYFPVSDLMASQ